MFSLALLLQLTAAQPADLSWHKLDTALLLGSSALIVTDCAMTQSAVSRGAREDNVFLGSHPSAGHLNTMCGTAVALNVAMGWLLPKNWRRVWYVGISGIESGAIVHNLVIGARLPT